VIVHLIRHGETDHNRGGLTLGRADIPLNELGRRQVGALAARLAHQPLGAIYTSPLSRARDTARAIAGEREIPLYVRDELLEMDVGETENITFAQLREQYPEFLHEWGGHSPELARMPGGENLVEVAQRLGPFLSDLTAITHDHIAVVSHNFVLKVILCRLLDLSLGSFRTFATDVASLSTIVLRDRRVTIRVLNDRCHLHALEP
jgi:broad specificity phosphatase PhoE